MLEVISNRNRRSLWKPDTIISYFQQQCKKPVASMKQKSGMPEVLPLHHIHPRYLFDSMGQVLRRWCNIDHRRLQAFMPHCMYVASVITAPVAVLSHIARSALFPQSTGIIPCVFPDCKYPWVALATMSLFSSQSTTPAQQHWPDRELTA